MTIQKITTDIIEDSAITGSKISVGTPEAGDIIYHDGTEYVKLAKGTDGDNLVLENGLPVWDVSVSFPSHLGGTMIQESASTSEISYLTIATLGNSQFFGTNTNTPDTQNAAAGNTNRTLLISAFIPSQNVNEIAFLNPNTLGSAITGGHGSLTQSRSSIGVCSDATRVVIGGGDLGSVNSDPGGYLAATNMEFIGIQNGGVAQELGELNVIGQSVAGVGSPADRNKMRQLTGCSDGTHGYWINGYGGFDNFNQQTNPPGAGFMNVVQKFTIQTNANCTQFGNMQTTSTEHFAETDGTHIVSGGGNNLSPSAQQRIEFMTNASGGNATSFGSFLIARRGIGSATNGTRAVINANSEAGNQIEYITLATTGDAQDFGDMNHDATSTNSACSGGNGGLG